MAIPYLTSIDLNKNELLNVRAQNLATDPQSPGLGQYWYNTTENKFSFYDGESVQRFATEAELTAALSDYQAKITATGLLKGDGAGNISAAEAGVDYQAPLTIDAQPTEGSSNPVQSGGVYSAIQGLEDGKQDEITANGILKGDGAGGVTAAEAGVDYQAPITVDANKALVSDANGKVAASAVTATELGYVAGVTGPIQDQIDNIPKYNYLDGISESVADTATEEEINTAAIAAITAAYGSPAKWDAVVVAVTKTPSDVVVDRMYYYNGTSWVYLYDVTTGIQVASGATAGIVESSEDISFAAGKGTVNQAAKLKTAVKISLSGVTATAQDFDGSADVTIPVTAVPASILEGQVAVAKGGTGVATLPAGEVLIGNGTDPVTSKAIDTEVTGESDNLVTSGAVAAALQNAGSVKKHTENNASLTPAGGVATWVVTHNLGSRAVIVDVAQAAAPYAQVMVDVEKTDVNTVTLKIYTSAAIAADTYTVTVLG